MKRSRFTDQQIAFALQQAEQGPTSDLKSTALRDQADS